MTNWLDYLMWKIVWERRKTQETKDQTLLQTLIMLNGFDTPPNMYSDSEWWDLVDQIVSISDLTSRSKVLEIGCGSGALIYGLKNRVDCEVFGIERSKTLYSIAKKNLPTATIFLMQASKLHSVRGKYDLVLMHSVAQYFPDYKYFLKVIKFAEKLLYKNGKILLMDLPDRQFKGSINYLKSSSKSLKGPRHLYYDKVSILRDLKGMNFANIQEFDHINKRYKNSSYRFNLMISR